MSEVMMRNACLIGGGKKASILREALGRSPGTPQVLIVPSASSTPASYAKNIPKNVTAFEKLGAKVDVLHAYGEAPTPTRRAEMFGRATMVFVAAGNSPYMLRTLREHGTDQDIVDSVAGNKMLAGVSAGGLLPFAVGHSNPNRPGEPVTFTTLPMFGLVPAAAAMHANRVEPDVNITRLTSFDELFPQTGQRYGLAIDNDAGLLVTDGIAGIERSGESGEYRPGIHFRHMAGGMMLRETIEDNARMDEVWQQIHATAEPA